WVINGASGVELTGGGVVGFPGGGHPCADRLLAGTVPGHCVSFRHGPTHPPGCNDASQGNARVSDPCPRRQVQRGWCPGSERAGAAAVALMLWHSQTKG